MTTIYMMLVPVTSVELTKPKIITLGKAD